MEIKIFNYFYTIYINQCNSVIITASVIICWNEIHVRLDYCGKEV